MTAAELIAHYSEVRKRLFSKPKIKKEPAPFIEKPIVRTPLSEIAKVFNRPREKRIIERIAKAYSTTPGEITGASRALPLVYARQAAIYWVHRRMGYAKKQTGRVFNRDHTTVIHAIKAHEKRRAERNRKRMEKLNAE